MPFIKRTQVTRLNFSILFSTMACLDPPPDGQGDSAMLDMQQLQSKLHSYELKLQELDAKNKVKYKNQVQYLIIIIDATQTKLSVFYKTKNPLNFRLSSTALILNIVNVSKNAPDSRD